MIATMRPDIDNVDEYVRNTTARAFSVVASALGVPALLPFLKAVCQSKKSWQARHTGIKIVQQIAILMGCSVLPHLRSLVEIIEAGLQDEQQKVRTITALSLAALAEASSPYGIEAFDSVLKPLWKGIRQHRGKGLAAFLKAIGYIIPLMDAEYANYYTREVHPSLRSRAPHPRAARGYPPTHQPTTSTPHPLRTSSSPTPHLPRHSGLPVPRSWSFSSESSRRQTRK